MLTITDTKQYVTDYILYSGENPADWDIDAAARALYDICDEQSIKPDEVDVDWFIDMMASCVR